MFCGRHRELREILNHCHAGRLVVLTSQPGLGATALLTEGVAPRLCAEGFVAVVIREWQGRSILTEMKETIAAAVRAQADDTFSAQPETLAEMLSRIRTRTGRPIAILFDQFEDYLRCHVRTHLSDSIDAELGEAATGHGSWFLIALQEHSISELLRLEQLIPNLLAFEIRLGPLEVAVAREAVMRTGDDHNIRFEPTAVDALVTAPTAAFEDGVHPFYLMLGVDRLLAAGREKKWTTVTSGMIQTFGGADRLILESLDPVLSTLTATQTDLLFLWFPLLLSESSQRLAVTAEGLRDYSGKLNRFALNLIPALTRLGILRAIEIGDTARYEIARDSLTPLARDWRTRRGAMLIARRRARFRVGSVSLAVGSIVALYLIWLVTQIRG